MKNQSINAVPDVKTFDLYCKIICWKYLTKHKIIEIEVKTLPCRMRSLCNVTRKLESDLASN